MPVGTWVSISTSRCSQDAPVSQDFGFDVVNDLNYLYNNSLPTTDTNNAPVVPNGSFEVDAPGSSPQTPSGWLNLVLGTGATGAVSSAQSNHGAQSYAFTRDNTAGHYGGQLYSGYLNVNPLSAYDLIFFNMNTRADVENQVVINWFTAALAPIKTTVVYDSGLGANAPTVWTPIKCAAIVPPSNAVIAQVVVYAGISAQTPALTATMYFDGFGISRTTVPGGTGGPGGNGGYINTINGGPVNITVPNGAFHCEGIQCNPGGGGDWGNSQASFCTFSFPVTPGTSIYVDSSLDCHYAGYVLGFNNFCNARFLAPNSGVHAVPNQLTLTFRP